MKTFEATVTPITDIPKHLRWKREWVFKIINRGSGWYNTLTEIQKQELQVWYQGWLDVTDTLIEPIKPTWLD